MSGRALKAGDLPADTLIFDETDDDISPAESESNENLANLLADLGELDSIKVHVSRVGAGNKLSWISSYTPSELDIDTLMSGLRNDYGGGKFKIVVREDGRIRKAKVIEIEPPPEKPEIDTSALIREMQEGQKKESGGMATVLAEIIKANSEAARHQADQMQGFMQTMITAMAGGNQNAPAASPMEMQESIMKSMVAMKKLTDSEPKQDATAMILKGVELVSAIRGDEGGGDANIYSLLSNAMKSFGGTLTQAMNMAPMPGQLPAPGQPLGIEAGGESPELNPAADAQNQGLQANQTTLPEGHALRPFEPYVDWMISLARKNANPDLYAEVIIDQIGPETALAWLAEPEGIETLMRELPKIQPHLAWFMAVGQAVDGLVDEQLAADNNPPDLTSQPDGDADAPTGLDNPTISDNSSPDGDSPRPGGDTGDVAGNVSFGVTSENGDPNT